MIILKWDRKEIVMVDRIPPVEDRVQCGVS